MLGENSRGPSDAATAVIACLDGENIGVSLLSAVNHWLSSGQPGAALRTESSPRRFRKTPPSENKRRNPTRDRTAGAVHSWKTRLLVCKKIGLLFRHGMGCMSGRYKWESAKLNVDAVQRLLGCQFCDPGDWHRGLRIMVEPNESPTLQQL